MATNKNIKECGWFYHAPAKRQPKSEPVPVPYTSQIPGLNTDLPPEEEAQRSLFKDTDTKYVRLAKSGGRQTLLQFKENLNMREREPVSYPRNEWFYLEDNRLEAEEEKEKTEPYQFTVPEYMYHEVFNPDAQSDSYERPRRAPYGFDNVSAFERDGKGATDKTVKLPEVIKPGYGVRSSKPFRTKKAPPPPAGMKTSQQVATAKMATREDGRDRLKYLPLPEASDKTEKPKMTKLLSYAYDREWQDEVRKWEYKQDRLREKHRQMIASQGPQNKEPLVSEYNTTIGKARQPVYQPQRRGHAVDSAHNSSRSAVSSTTASKKTAPEKELFKMSKFKNVSSRVDQTMPKAMIAATN
ncbi:uncharacterized protein C7orf57 homolog [Saccostrea cucullata]|uniref:uncharacterized protein C7orf57 homolog n=1 Tax=Saccostrea cuccullata TaxID=36930 RepID=UPI002ED2E7B3